MNYAIQVENLTKVYGRPGTGVLAVDHISFEVYQDEVFGFLGPNGAGKTTTQRMLTTLLEPTGRRIVIEGHDLAHDAYPVKRQMGLVPEEATVYTELTAWGNLMFTAQLYRVPIANVGLLVIGLPLSSLTFSAFGLLFASLPARSVGSIMMPSTLIRWPLLFISGIFVPLTEIAPWARALSFLSPLTYTQDLMNHAVPNLGYLNPWLDLALLPLLTAGFLAVGARLHRRSRVLGY